MGERLREVAEVASAERVDLLRVKTQRARVRQEFLAERGRLVQCADLDER